MTMADPFRFDRDYHEQHPIPYLAWHQGSRICGATDADLDDLGWGWDDDGEPTREHPLAREVTSQGFYSAARILGARREAIRRTKAEVRRVEKLKEQEEAARAKAERRVRVEGQIILRQIEKEIATAEGASERGDVTDRLADLLQASA